MSLDPQTDADEARFLFANIGAVLILVGIFSFGFTVLTGVVEEKQSRVVEVVLSTVRPRDLLMGKVLGIGILGLVQLVVFVARGARRGRADRSVRAARDDARRDPAAGRLVHPRVRAVLDGARLPGRARVADGGGVERLDAGHDDRDGQLLRGGLRGHQRPVRAVAQVATFLPPSAPFVVPLRAAFDAIGPLEIVLSIAVTVLGIWVLFSIGARVYAGPCSRRRAG